MDEFKEQRKAIDQIVECAMIGCDIKSIEVTKSLMYGLASCGRLNVDIKVNHNET